jgi:hypothetical protein
LAVGDWHLLRLIVGRFLALTFGGLHSRGSTMTEHLFDRLLLVLF